MKVLMFSPDPQQNPFLNILGQKGVPYQRYLNCQRC